MRKCQQGVVYLSLMFSILLIGVGLATLGELWATERQREKEQELLQIGDEFRRALQSYTNTAGQAGAYPTSLDHLVKDPRFPGVRRHLRRIYVDPITGKAEWGSILAPDGKGIMGVHSLSNARPLKTAGFPTRYAGFKNKQAYSDWKFVYNPSMPGMASVVEDPNAPGGNLGGPLPGGPPPAAEPPPTTGPSLAPPGPSSLAPPPPAPPPPPQPTGN